MIAHLRGTLDRKNTTSVVIDAGGLGYEVFVPSTTLAALPGTGAEVKLYISESTSMYAGGTTLYGFLTSDEKDIFTLLRDEVPGAGAKKALEYMDKVTRSVPDFRKAVVNKDADMLVSLFGFTKKTADKLISSLKDKTGSLPSTGKEKYTHKPETGARTEAIAGLVALGYREAQARDAVDKALNDIEPSAAAAQIIKAALRHL